MARFFAASLVVQTFNPFRNYTLNSNEYLITSVNITVTYITPSFFYEKHFIVSFLLLPNFYPQKNLR